MAKKKSQKKFAKPNLKLNIKKTSVKPKLSQKNLIFLAVVLGAIMLGVGGWAWWNKILINPDRVLSDTIAKNLSTNSVTRNITQGDTSSGINQTAHISFFAPYVSAQTSTVLSQKGPSRQDTKITTETIGTREADFVRYSNAEGTEGLPGAENLNSLIGQWAKKETGNNEGQSLTFLNESLFGVVPFGDLDSDKRDKLMKVINDKKLYNYTSAKREFQNYRPVYVYKMSITTADLVEVLSTYARLTGLADSDQFNPAEYANAPPISVDITIDIVSRNLVKVVYNNTQRTENYSGWNLYKPVTLPTNTIPIDDLQKKLQGQTGA